MRPLGILGVTDDSLGSLAIAVHRSIHKYRLLAVDYAASCTADDNVIRLPSLPGLLPPYLAYHRDILGLNTDNTFLIVVHTNTTTAA